ncbi:hypothetical protein W97_05929 [Coniosporium apollinis CBS 100218]|uniref:Uncharacterized protein n=1 Tax=Coniosporium apollinis (strain CBS 100218) TaxID=1168221 RepID=R7YXV7_CONA1|nr:uncharacterized protein W97_05929 [Coniosporium apollinis CBS 100218]EON66683.1 hypothetical protein W97_05929 [Coniosporium apollinis CBS 100218]
MTSGTSTSTMILPMLNTTTAKPTTTHTVYLGTTTTTTTTFVAAPTNATTTFASNATIKATAAPTATDKKISGATSNLSSGNFIGLVAVAVGVCVGTLY